MRNSDWRHVYSESKTSVAIIETVTLTLLGILLDYWLKPEPPNFSVSNFSCLILGPLLSGLRFGLFYSLSSLAILALIALIGHRYQIAWVHDLSLDFGLFLLSIAIVAGEFRNYWYRRIKRLNAAALYLNERFSEVSHAFNMLKYSHDRLEQILASKVSLRDSISNIRRQILISSNDNDDFYGLGSLILKSLADLGSLQGVSLHKLDQVTKVVSVKPVAFIGNLLPLDITNPVLLKSIATRKTVALKLDLISQNEGGILLAIPLVDIYDNIFGVIAVNKMPFRAYREDNIQLLSVVGGYIGDLLSTKVQPDKSIKNEALQSFYMQAMRCMQDATTYNLSASLLGFEFGNQHYADKLVRVITRQQRGLDQLILLKNRDGNQVALLILPLTDRRKCRRLFIKVKKHHQNGVWLGGHGRVRLALFHAGIGG